MSLKEAIILRIKKMSNKRGTLIVREMLEHLGKLAIIALVFYLLASYVRSIEKDTRFQNIFLSRDAALLTNALYGAPGDLSYTYSFEQLDLGKFRFEFKRLPNADGTHAVKVESEGVSKSYPYAVNIQDNEDFSVSGAKSIKFSKTGSKVVPSRNE